MKLTLQILLAIMLIQGALALAVNGFEVDETGKGFARDRVVDGFECVGALGGEVSTYLVHDHFAYLAQGCVMHIWNVADPDHPHEISWVKFSSEINSISIRFPAVYIATRYGNVSVLDAGTPESPRFTMVLDTSSPSLELNAQVAGNLLLVCEDGHYGSDHELYDIRNPLKPVSIASYQRTRLSLFLTDGNSWFSLLNLGMNAGKLKRGMFADGGTSETVIAQFPFAEDESTTYGLILREGILHVACNRSSMTVPMLKEKDSLIMRTGSNVSDYIVADAPQHIILSPAQKKEQACIDKIINQQKAYKFDEATISGDRAYLLNYSGTMTILDVKDPTQPGLWAHYALPSGMTSLAVEDGHLYLCDTTSTLYCLDGVASNSARILGKLKLSTRPLRMAAEGNILLLAMDEGGMLIIDTTNPRSLRQIGSYKIHGKCDDVAISGTLALIAAGDLEVVDIQNPAKPTLVRSYPFNSDRIRIQRLRDTVYLAGSGLTELHYHLGIVDLRTPASKDNPKLFDFSLREQELHEYDNTAMRKGTQNWYLGLPECYRQTAESQSGMIFYDLSDPWNPRPLGEYWHLAVNWERKPLLFRDFAFVADNENGLLVLRRKAIQHKQ